MFRDEEAAHRAAEKEREAEIRGEVEDLRNQARAKQQLAAEIRPEVERLEKELSAAEGRLLSAQNSARHMGMSIDTLNEKLLNDPELLKRRRLADRAAEDAEEVEGRIANLRERMS